MKNFADKIFNDDCLKVLPKLPKNSVDLIVTSPPYAQKRKKSYDGVAESQYVEWFLPIALELKRVLKDDGSFVLNIKEPAVNAERSTFVIELILEMKKQGWLWTEEYIWHKRNSFPGKWPNRFRDAWERCLHFTKNKKFKMNQDDVMVPMGEWAQTRFNSLSDEDKTRHNSASKSGFGRKVENWIGRKKAYPTNVLEFATVCYNKGHSAAFPEELPEWFIKLFSDPGDLVLDPFIGSGTTAIVAKRLQRRYLGIEKQKKYYDLSKIYLEIENIRSKKLKKQIMDIIKTASRTEDWKKSILEYKKLMSRKNSALEHFNK